MSEKMECPGTDKSRKGEYKANRSEKSPIKIAEIIYGKKNLVDCMESVIRLHMEKQAGRIYDRK